MLSKLYIVGGSSGSGKTAIMPDLQRLLKASLRVYDFDDIGVPEGADKQWRQSSTEQWLKKLLENNEDACLLGQVVLGEIISCPTAKALGHINYCFLDVSDFERVQRLAIDREQEADQSILNWSSWLRMHHVNPHWVPHVITEGAWAGLDFSILSHLSTWDSVANVHYMDTTGLSIKDVANRVAEWVNE